MWRLAVTLSVVLLAHTGAAQEAAVGAAKDCECVPYYVCSNDTINEDGSLLIDIRKGSHSMPIYFDASDGTPSTEVPKPPTAEHKKQCGIRNPEGVGFRVRRNLDYKAQFSKNAVATFEVVDPLQRWERSTDEMNVGEYDCPNYLEVCCKRHPLEERDTQTLPMVDKNPGDTVLRTTGDQDHGANFAEFPWMVAVLRVEKEGDNSTMIRNAYQCGGSLIHPRVVLIGAHCVAGKEGIHLKIRAGDWDAQSNNELYKHQDRDVERIVIHENFKDNNLINDIALLFLTESVDPAENIGFACLPVQGVLPAPGTHCFASGWAENLIGKDGRVTLRKVELPVVDNQQCQTLLRKTRLYRYFRLHSSFICAGGEKDQDICKDGGGPLVCPIQNSPNQYIQSGILAWGILCGEAEIPGVYANVALFRKWIDAKMAEAQLDATYYTY